MGTSIHLSLTLILLLSAHTVYGQVWNPLGLWNNSKKAEEASKGLEAPKAALFANIVESKDLGDSRNARLEIAEQNTAKAKENLLGIDSFYQRAQRGGGDGFFLREVVPTLADVINRKVDVKKNLLQRYLVLYSNEQLIKEAFEEHKKFVSLVSYDEWLKKHKDPFVVSIDGKDTVVDPRLSFLAEQMLSKANDLRSSLPEEEKMAIVQYAEAKDQEMSLLLDQMLRENGEKIKSPDTRRRMQSSLDSYLHGGAENKRAFEKLKLDLEGLPPAKPE